MHATGPSLYIKLSNATQFTVSNFYTLTSDVAQFLYNTDAPTLPSRRKLQGAPL